MSHTVYTFATDDGDTVTFTRPANESFERWFAISPTYNKSLILRATERRTVYDIGGYDYPQLTIRAVFASEADRVLCKSMAMRRATLTNTRGREADVLLVKVGEGEGEGSQYGLTLDLTFEKVD